MTKPIQSIAGGATSAAADTAALKIMSAGAVQHILTASAFDWTDGGHNPVDLEFGTVGAIKDKFASREPADIVVVSVAAMRELEGSGLLAPGSLVPLGKTLSGVAVREGAPLPDISTTGRFKEALLAARSVAYADPKSGGTSGTFFAGLLERLGIAEAVNAKARLGRNGRAVAESVASGEAEIGSTFISEILPVAGVQMVGPLPADIQNATAYMAGIAAESPNRAAATAFLAALTAPARRPQWTAAGFEPVTQS